MNIRVHGQLRERESSKTLQDFVKKHIKSSSPIVAEINGDIIKKVQWDKTELREGDVVELITLFGGG